MADARIPEMAQQRYQDTLDLLKQIVELESPSNEKQAVDKLVDFLQGELERRDAEVERVAQAETGDLLIARWPGDDREPLFVMTHIDTVWPVGTLERLPWKVEGDVARGPGIYDMKASVAMMLTAIDILKDLGHTGRPIVWLINTDEEIGSPGSREYIERYAKESAYVLCLEPPVPPDDALKTERKGVGMFNMKVRGRAAHAGADHQNGISAIEELARQIQWLHSLTDYDKGTTVNVGVISGGTKRNVVAAEAEALIDLRVTTMAEAERMVPLIKSAKAQLEGATVEIHGDLNRPPMERSPHVLAAFERAQEIARTIGQEVVESSTGGGSDGNFTAALGVPTIDGLGCPGDGAHAETEHIQLPKVAPRTALITALLADL
ncbi:MAG TPA: M20 family metallopeptidase [Thermomicrobiales bacterium]|nr:M20 family metallopeptidase [Thermomicrobiales bacterium]